MRTQITSKQPCANSICCNVCEHRNGTKHGSVENQVETPIKHIEYDENKRKDKTALLVDLRRDLAPSEVADRGLEAQRSSADLKENLQTVLQDIPRSLM